jgi:hypothetical protein
MPARSISRCETISASFGVSFRIGKKNRDNRMGRPGIAWDTDAGSETGSASKIQGLQDDKPRKSGGISRFRTQSKE